MTGIDCHWQEYHDGKWENRENGHHHLKYVFATKEEKLEEGRAGGKITD